MNRFPYLTTALLILIFSAHSRSQCVLNTPVVSGTTVLNCGQTTTLSATSNGNNFVWYSDSAGTNAVHIGSSFATLPLDVSDSVFYVDAVDLSSGSQTFNYTGGLQTWTVPAGVFSINVDVRGAAGGSGYSIAGLGGRVTGQLSVTPGQQIHLYVGQQGQGFAQYGCCNFFSTSVSFNGGGSGSGRDGCCGNIGFGSGGGASDIRIGGSSLNDRIVVAGGGGGAGGLTTNSGYNGGAGGGLTGLSGTGGSPGAGGTQTAGGSSSTSSGSFGQGGSGSGSNWGRAGGGGGGGWYGGGGGWEAGGGGGGSSYTSSAVSNVTHTQGSQSGHGQIIISWQAITCSSQRVTVPVTITNLSQPPVVSGTTHIVCGTQTTLTAVGNANSINWYTDATGGSPVHTTDTYQTPLLTSNDTFYAVTFETTPGGQEICHSSRTMVGIVVNDTVAPPTITGSSVICGMEDTLVVTGSSGHYRWYTQASGGTAFSTSDTIITPELLTSAVYYVEATSVPNAPYCSSTRKAVMVTVIPVPDPIVPPDTVVCGNSASLFASGSTGFYNWFTQPSGGSPFDTDTLVVVSPLSTTTYYAQAVTVLPPYSGSTSFTSPGTHTYTVPSGVFSIDVDLRGASGGSSWSPGGTGGRVTATIPVTPGQQIQVNVGEQGQGIASNSCNCTIWTTSSAFNGGGLGRARDGCCGNYGYGGGGGASDIRIGGSGLNDRVVVAGGGGGAGGQSSNGGFNGGAGGGLTGGNGSGFNPGSGGTQTTGGSSSSSSGSFGLGGEGNISNWGRGSGGGGGGWYGGGGGWDGGGGGGGSSYTAPQVANVVHQQGVHNGNGSVTITFNKVFCESQRIPVTVIVDSLPVPTAINDTVNCSQTATVGATGSSGQYNWYTQPVGGSPFSQGGLIATSAIFQPTTYYVEAYNPTFTSCRSPRVPVTIDIDSLPAPTVTGHDTLCDSGNTTFIASGAPSNATYTWFTAPGGNQLATGSSYATGTVTDTVLVHVRYGVGQCFSPYTPGVLLVTPTPIATITAPDSMCSGDGAVVLGTGTQGGTWAGTGIANASSGLFNPAAASLGFNQIIYSVTQSICSAADTTTIMVSQGPDATISNPGAQCVQSAPLTLSAMTSGGVWQGTGITDTILGSFNPAQAVTGTNTILYSVSAQGCTSVDTLQLVVNAQPDASLTSVPALCSTDPAFTIQAATSGGLFSGVGIVDTTTGFFDPSLAGAGTAQVVYALTQNGCSSADTLSVVVNATPVATINPPSLVCNNQSVFVLQSQTSGGTWSGAGVTNTQLGTFSPQSAPLGTLTIGYTVTQNGCTATDAIQLTVNPAPDATIQNAPNVLCSNASPLTLNSLFPSGTWSGNGIVDAQLGTLNPSLMNPGNNQITYSLTSSNGCSDSKHVTINQILAPNATIVSGNQQLCNNSNDVNFFAASVGGVWTGTGIVNAGQGTFSPSLAGIGTFDVVYSASQNGCFDSDTVQITVLNAPVVSVSPDGFQEFCEGNTFTLNASGATTYTWVKDGVVLPGQTSPNLTVLSSGSYTVFGSDGICGSTSANIPVLVNPAPVISLISAPAVCEGSLTNFSNNAVVPQNSGSVIASYAWDFGDGNVAAGNVAQHTYAAAGSYTSKLVITTNKGCSDSLTKVVHVNPIPQIQSVSSPNVCFPNLSNFNASATVANINNASIQGYSWSFGNGQSGIGATASNQYSQPGPYTYTLTATTNQGCSTSQSAVTFVYKKPMADFASTDVCTNVPAQFADLSDAFGDTVVSWNWNFGDGIGVSNMQNPVYQYNTPAGNYSVVLNVTTQSGCTDSRQRFVSVAQSPNALWTAQMTGVTTANLSPVNPNPNVTFVWHFPHDNTYYYQTNLSKQFPATGGDFQVCLSAQQNGCNVTECGNLYISPLSDEMHKEGFMSIFPNPFADMLTLEWDSQTEEEVQLSWFDLSGRLISKTVHAARLGGMTLQIDAAALGLSTGTYLLEVTQGELQLVRRIVKTAKQ